MSSISTNDDPFKTLDKGLNEAMTWYPNIMIKTSHFEQSEDGSIIPSYNSSINLINIISLFKIQGYPIIKEHTRSLLYPSNALLELEEFRFCDDNTAVINYVKAAFLAGHSVMSIRTSSTKQSSE